MKHGKDGKPIIFKVPRRHDRKRPTRGESIEILSLGQTRSDLQRWSGRIRQCSFQSVHKPESDGGNPRQTWQGWGYPNHPQTHRRRGLIGLPNAGKSSLLERAHPSKVKVGAYPFTTLDPYLGDFYGYLLADIPGLIEGASTGQGLGFKFLTHIERTRFIVHLVSAEQEDLSAAYTNIRNELELSAHGLGSKVRARRTLEDRPIDPRRR